MPVAAGLMESGENARCGVTADVRRGTSRARAIIVFVTAGGAPNRWGVTSHESLVMNAQREALQET